MTNASVRQKLPMNPSIVLSSRGRQRSRVLSLVLDGLCDVRGLWDEVTRSSAAPTWASWKTRSGKPELPYKKLVYPAAKITWKDYLGNAWRRTEARLSPAFQQLPQRDQAYEQNPASPKLNSTS